MAAPFVCGSGAAEYHYRGPMRLTKGPKDEGALLVPREPRSREGAGSS